MRPEAFFEEEAERLRVEYEAGRFASLIDAVLEFSGNGQPLPTWAADAVLGHLSAIYQKGLGGRRGRGGGHRQASREMHLQRWTMVDNLLRLQRVRDGKAVLAKAKVEASERLRNTPAAGTPRQIEESYRKIEGEMAATAGDGPV